MEDIIVDKVAIMKAHLDMDEDFNKYSETQLQMLYNDFINNGLLPLPHGKLLNIEEVK